MKDAPRVAAQVSQASWDESVRGASIGFSRRPPSCSHIHSLQSSPSARVACITAVAREPLRRTTGWIMGRSRLRSSCRGAGAVRVGRASNPGQVLDVDKRFGNAERATVLSIVHMSGALLTPIGILRALTRDQASQRASLAFLGFGSIHTLILVRSIFLRRRRMLILASFCNTPQAPAAQR